MARGCNAAWCDQIVSSADNRTSCCCMYMGDAPTTFRPDGSLASIMENRNSPQLQAVRRHQAGGARQSGCDGCIHTIDLPPGRRPVYFDYEVIGSLSERQAANLALVRQEVEDGAIELRSAPLRYLLYFSWFCNLSCVICNQLQSRDHMPDTLPDDLYERWRDAFASALWIDCIGGEPFTIPPAIGFIRKFVADAELAEVRLRLTSNGTLLHKHLPWLKAKERISFNISIDSIGAGYEAVRVGGTWAQVRDNLLAIRDLMRTERPLWRLGTNALITKTGVPFLPDFARFHVEEGIGTFFQVLKLDRGNEEALYREDILTYPALLDDVPGWDESFTEAIAIFERGNHDVTAQALRGFRDRLRRALADPCQSVDPFGRRVAEVDGAADILRLIVGNLQHTDNPPVLNGALAEYTSPDPGFGVAAKLNFQGGVPGGGIIGLRLSWPAILPPGAVHCQSVVYDFQSFRALRWRERFEGNRREVDLVVQSLAPAGQDVALLLMLMSGGAKRRNILPTRLELWVREA